LTLAPPPRHFLDLDALDAPTARRILDEAHRRKRARAGLAKGAPDSDVPLRDHVLAGIFEKNSTRTRVSFDIAMRQLGGAMIYLSAADTQLGRGETVEDTARVLSRMVDCVTIRANRHDTLVDFAAVADVPTINGLTDKSHPCQIFADLMTREERGVALSGAKIAWVGDGNNVCTSLIHGAPLCGYELAIAAPRLYAPNADAIAAAQKAGATIIVSEEETVAVAGAQAVVTDTWVSMGDTDKEARMQALAPFQVDQALMARAAAKAVFLHCLPAHRGEEVTEAVIDGPQSAVWDEAENRIHAQKAILLWCLGKVG
jgi:ornithine carbamoyltransferase